MNLGRTRVYTLRVYGRLCGPPWRCCTNREESGEIKIIRSARGVEQSERPDPRGLDFFSLGTLAAMRAFRPSAAANGCSPVSLRYGRPAGARGLRLTQAYARRDQAGRRPSGPGDAGAHPSFLSAQRSWSGRRLMAAGSRKGRDQAARCSFVGSFVGR
ncbi:unnamed protein product, partial [Phaeothamnion confervicola]